MPHRRTYSGAYMLGLSHLLCRAHATWFVRVVSHTTTDGRYHDPA